MSTSLIKLLPNLSKEADFFSGEGGGKKLWEIQQWHSRALNMRKLTQCGPFAVKFHFCKYGEKVINGKKIRRRCEVGVRRVTFPPHNICAGLSKTMLSPSPEPISELSQWQLSYPRPLK